VHLDSEDFALHLRRRTVGEAFTNPSTWGGHQNLQVGVAEDEVLVTAEVVAVPEASPEVLYIVVLVRSTERLLDEMVVPFPEAVVEFGYCAETVPKRATAIVTNVFFIVSMG